MPPPEGLSFEGPLLRGAADDQSRLRRGPPGLADGDEHRAEGGEYDEAPMPDAPAATLAGKLTSVAGSVDGETINMYTNGKRLMTLTDRKSLRSRSVA